MEYYESTCQKCKHRWRWVGYKTGIGKTAAQLAEMRVAGTVCPLCKGPALRGLDNTSQDAVELNNALRELLLGAFGPKKDQ
jgi:hypothetical protein